jgi:hypothetical protein
MWKTVFSHKDIVKLSYDFVAVVGHSNPDHGEADFSVAGKKTHLCNVYNLPSCQAHETMASALTQKNLLPDVRGTPTHIIYNAKDMTEISRSNSQSVSSMEDSIVAAQKVIGKPITWKVFSKMQKSLDEAEVAIAEGDFRKASKALKGFDAEGMPSLEQRAEKLAASILEAGNARLEEARGMIAEGRKADALQILRDITRDFSGTELADEAKKLMVEAKQEE